MDIRARKMILFKHPDPDNDDSIGESDHMEVDDDEDKQWQLVKKNKMTTSYLNRDMSSQKNLYVNINNKSR